MYAWLGGERMTRVRHRLTVRGVLLVVAALGLTLIGPSQFARAADAPADIPAAKQAAAQTGQTLTPDQAWANVVASNPAAAAQVQAEVQVGGEGESGASTGAAAASLSYSGSKAATYADYWTCDTNTGVLCRNGAYQSLGNDCTNFVSQALHAGGLPYSSGAWEWKPYDRAWAYAPSLIGFIQHHYPNSTFTRYSGSGLSAHYTSGLVGDLVFYDWGKGSGYSHVAMIVGWGTRGYYYTQYGAGDYMDQHTSDRYHAPWNYGYLHPDSSIDRTHMQVLIAHLRG